MTWFAQSANATEAEREHAHIFLAAAITLASGTVRVWSGYGDISIGGYTYSGIGTMGSITNVTERAGLLSEKKAFRLSGVDPSLVSEADIDSSFGRSITEYFGFLTSAGVLVAEPEIRWEGRIDAINRVDSDEPYIEIMASNRMAMLDIANGWRMTHEHQQQFFAGDDGLKLVPTTVTTDVKWGENVVLAGMVSYFRNFFRGSRGG